MSRLRWFTACAVSAVVAIGGLVGMSSANGAGSVRSSVALTAPSSGTYGSTIKLTGAVWRTGTSVKIPGATVYLQRSVRGVNRFGNLASTRTSSAGAFVFSVRQVYAYDYRVYYPGSATYARSFSPTRYPVVNRYLALDSIATTDPGRNGLGELSVTGHAVPAPPNGTIVYLQRYHTDARVWANIAAGKTVSGRVTIPARRPGSNDWYRLVIGSRWPYGPGVSNTKLFAHYVWRGAFTRPVGVTYSTTASTVQQVPTDLSNAIGIDTAGANSRVQLTLNSSGCIKAHSITRSELVAKPVVVELYSAADFATKTINSNGQDVELNINTVVDSVISHSVKSDDSIHVRTKLELLCVN